MNVDCHFGTDCNSFAEMKIAENAVLAEGMATKLGRPLEVGQLKPRSTGKTSLDAVLSKLRQSANPSQ